MTKTANPKLTMVRTAQVHVTQFTTTSEDYFKEAGVFWMGDSFQAQFLGLEITVQESVELAVHQVHQLTENLPDKEILAELGDKAKISVSWFRAFLNTNRESREWFVFYLVGKDGNLWAVNAHWDTDDGGWHVRADSVKFSIRWIAGSYVVSRN